MVYKLIKKVFALSESRYTYPIYYSYKHYPKQFKAQVKNLFLKESKILDAKKSYLLFRKNRRNEHFFRYGLLAIISIFQFEALIRRKIETKEK